MCTGKVLVCVLLGFHLKNERCDRSRRTGDQPVQPLVQTVIRCDESSNPVLASKVGNRRGDEARHQNCHPASGERRVQSGQENRFVASQPPTPAPLLHIRAPLLPRQPFRQPGSSKFYLQQNILFVILFPTH